MIGTWSMRWKSSCEFAYAASDSPPITYSTGVCSSCSAALRTSCSGMAALWPSGNRPLFIITSVFTRGSAATRMACAPPQL